MFWYPVTVLQEAGKITVWRLETGHVRRGIFLWQQWTFCFIPGICSSNDSFHFHINVTFRVNWSTAVTLPLFNEVNRLQRTQPQMLFSYLGWGLHAVNRDWGWMELRHRSCRRSESKRCDSSSLSPNPSSQQKPATQEITKAYNRYCTLFI